MQDINLLQNKLKDRSTHWEKQNNLLLGILAVLVLVVLGAAAMLFVLSGNTAKQTEALKMENDQIRRALDSGQKDLTAAKALQAQLTNVNTLLNGHVHWSKFYQQIQESVFDRTQYTSLQARNEGQIHLEGVVDSYTDLGKVMLALSANKNFSNVHLLSVQSNEGQRTGHTYSIDFLLDRSLLINE